MKKPHSINVQGRLLSLDKPVVMGILNITDDSFYEGSRVVSPAALAQRAKDMLDAGAAMLDVGACSTRPGAEPVGQELELARLHGALEVLDKEVPHAVVSVDTFRGAVVRECVAQHNVSVINDVSGFEWDDDMFDAVAMDHYLKVCYEDMWAEFSDEYGKTVLDYALEFENYDFLKFLMDILKNILNIVNGDIGNGNAFVFILIVQLEISGAIGKKQCVQAVVFLAKAKALGAISSLGYGDNTRVGRAKKEFPLGYHLLERLTDGCPILTKKRKRYTVCPQNRSLLIKNQNG
mgnify:CR=1 FL=1